VNGELYLNSPLEGWQALPDGLENKLKYLSKRASTLHPTLQAPLKRGIFMRDESPQIL
jgi:hypothetical protein